MSSLRLGVEVGGTFTDWIVLRDGHALGDGKVLSTPNEPARGVMDAVHAAAVSLEALASVVHGSTVATNTVLERKGAPTCLVTTRGFRDVLEIQRQGRSRLFDLFYRHPEPLVSRDRIVEVDERIGPTGAVWRRLTLGSLIRDVRSLIVDSGIESVAICLLHSYANPENEMAIASALEEEFPDLYLTRSSDVLPRFREYERASTTVINAYVKPRVDRYMEGLTRILRDGGFLGHFSVMQANGGTVPATEVKRRAATMILSGPAAGVIGAVKSAMSSGFTDLLTFDMGGTSTDVCLAKNNTPRTTTEYKVGGLPLGLPILDIVTVGAGGGSVASVDRGGALCVGPESAGAMPGPACFGRGGQGFTVTDAHVLLGLIRPTAFFGGEMPLDGEAAAHAASRVAMELGIDPLELATGVVKYANATMAQAMRLVTIERGHDPREYTIVAFGGAGPLHAALLAEELDISTVLIPFKPGILSAQGLLLADTRQDYSQTRLLAVDTLNPEVLGEAFADLQEQAANDFQAYGISSRSVDISRVVYVRQRGQAYELPIDVSDLGVHELEPSTLTHRFFEAHLLRYGHVSRDIELEIVGFHVTALHPNTQHAVRPLHPDQDQKPRWESGMVHFDTGLAPCAFYRRDTMPVGSVIHGHAVIEESTATTFVPHGWSARVETNRNLILSRGGTT